MENEKTYETSASITEIAKALVAFHKEVCKIKKTATNPFFKSKYASLPDILEAIEKPLESAGLSFVQFPTGKNNLTTQLMHTGGEWIRGEYFMQPAKEDPQGYGSCITYQRRYALGAILGLNTDEDDDGNKASGLTYNPETEKAPVCDKCGSVGIKAKTKTGVVFWTCPEYKTHKAEGEKFKMIHKPELSEAEKSFSDDLDQIK